jgi:hypothetical protein
VPTWRRLIELIEVLDDRCFRPPGVCGYLVSFGAAVDPTAARKFRRSGPNRHLKNGDLVGRPNDRIP